MRAVSCGKLHFLWEAEIHGDRHMETHWQRPRIAILIVIGLVAQLLVWATHTHAHAGLQESALQCHSQDNAADDLPCVPHDEHGGCEICGILAGTGFVILPLLVAPFPPRRVSGQLHEQAVRRLLTARLLLGYRSRAPPVRLAR